MGGPIESVRSVEYAVLVQMLRAERERTGISQRALSKTLGRDNSYVSKVEQGTRRIDVVELHVFLSAIRSDLVGFIERYAAELRSKGS